MTLLSSLFGTANQVTAGAVITDNTIVRGDGGSRGVQKSGVTISDTDVIGNVTDPASAQDAATKNYVEAGNFDARIKGWIQFNGTGTIAIQDSFNVSSIEDAGTGRYTVNWDTDFANNDYVCSGLADGYDIVGTAIATGSMSIGTYDWTNTTYADSDKVYIMAIGDQ